jgi:hypothetical protein
MTSRRVLTVTLALVYRATIPKDLDWILQAVGDLEKGS